MSGDAGDRGQDLGLALQGLVASQQFPDLGVHPLQLALDLAQPVLVQPLRQAVAQVFAPVDRGGSVPDQRVAHQLQFGEVTVAPGLRRGWAQVVDRIRHRRHRPGIDGVGLGAATPRASEAPDVVWIDRVQRKSGLLQGILEVAMVGPGGLVGDAPGPWADPGDQLPESGRVVRESCRPALRCDVGVEVGFRDVDPDGMVGHLPFSCACRASHDAHVSIQDVGKDGGDQTHIRPLAAKPETVRPPPPFGAPLGGVEGPGPPCGPGLK